MPSSKPLNELAVIKKDQKLAMKLQSSELMISNRKMLEIAQGRSKLSLDLPDSDANHNAAVSHNHPSNYNNRKSGKARPLLHIN